MGEYCGANLIYFKNWQRFFYQKIHLLKFQIPVLITIQKLHSNQVLFLVSCFLIPMLCYSRVLPAGEHPLDLVELHKGLHRRKSINIGVQDLLFKLL